jgi:hypothetical protein
MKQYKNRCAYSLDCENGIDKSYYSAHISAMTAEGLHNKSDIAAELAVRDAHIDYLIRQLIEYSGRDDQYFREDLPQFE